MLWAANHRIRKKPGGADFDPEVSNRQSLTQGNFLQRQIVVPKIPVPALDAFDIRSERDQSPARSQAAEYFIQRSSESGLVGEVFKKIAGENDIQFGRGQRPGGRAVLVKEANVRVR